MKDYLAIVSWTSDNRVAKYQDFDTQAQAQAHVDGWCVDNGFLNAFVAKTPNQTRSHWLVNSLEKTVSIVVPPPEPDNSIEVVEAKMKRDPFLRAWVRRQARKEGKLPQAIRDEIKAEIT